MTENCAGCGTETDHLHQDSWCQRCAPGAKAIEALVSTTAAPGPSRRHELSTAAQADTQLRLLYAARVSVEQHMAAAVAASRSAGRPWAEIADVLHSTVDDLQRRTRL